MSERDQNERPHRASMAWLLYGLGYVLLDIRVRRALNQQFFRANPSNDIKAQFLGQRWRRTAATD